MGQLLGEGEGAWRTGLGHEGSGVASTRPRRGKTRVQNRDEAWLPDRARELAEAGGQGELGVPRVPDEPSAEERARHEVTHVEYQPWCAWCVRGKVVQNRIFSDQWKV